MSTIPETVRSPEDLALVKLDAAAHPEQYFTCDVCGDGPWHVGWCADEWYPGKFDVPKLKLCPNCYGAD